MTEHYARSCPRRTAAGWGYTNPCRADVLDDGRKARCVNDHELTNDERRQVRKEDQ